MKKILESQFIHCIGIGGTGVSGLARILQQMGKQISGSDEKESLTTQNLKSEGIQIFIGHNSKNIHNKIETIVYSQAIPLDNPEILEAKKLGIPLYTYSQGVGELTRIKKTISISGTHGKTTTTGLITSAFISAGQDPTVIVGSNLHELNGKNERLGKGTNFILESCEYRRSFMDYQPEVAIITNIEPDHLDYYKNLKDYQSAFHDFIKKVPENGFIIVNGDDENIVPLLTSDVKGTVVRFGKSEKNDYQIQNDEIMKKGKLIAKLDLQIPGEHNIMNAAAAIAVSDILGLDLATAIIGINSYRGAGRRLELISQKGKTLMYDDYGHHPTEIKATLKALRNKYGNGVKILCIFQPHQYSRTFKLLDDFATAFHDADRVIIPNILRARDTEEDLKNVNVDTLVERIKKDNPNTQNGLSLEQTAKLVETEINKYDIIITMGAGDVWKIHQLLTKEN